MRLVDIDTGELVLQLKDNDKPKLIHELTKKYLKEKVKCLIKNHTKVNINELSLLNKELSHSEKIFLFSVIPYIDYDNCKIKYNNQYNIKLIDFVEISGLNEKTIRLTIHALIDKKLIYKDKKIYYLNPWLMSKGKAINKSLFFMFYDYQIRSKDNKRWKEL